MLGVLYGQAESVLQLIESQTVVAADSALAGLQGGIGDEVRRLREACNNLLAELEVDVVNKWSHVSL